nr:glutathione-dependent formaldehyde-activating enzyme [uncultured bacterium]
MKKTYSGSCHCGAVRFEADIDLAAGTNKCNCTICTKTRNWNAIIKPDAFRLLTSENALNDYQFGRKSMHHLFCRHCGVHSFAHGYVEEIGGAYVAVQLAALDNITPQELIDAPVRYADGRHNDWGTPPQEIRHL